MTFEYARRDGVLRVERPGTRWLSTGAGGGFERAPAAYNITVPEGFDRTDLAVHARERRRAAGFHGSGPTMLTGVNQQHARAAHDGSVACVATAGLSNPAAFAPTGASDVCDGDAAVDSSVDDNRPPGTVNLVVGTSRALDRGVLATLLATVIEAKTAALRDATGFTGTTTDAAVVGCDPRGPRAGFAGSGTEVGAAARGCVRAAVTTSLAARYADEPPPASHAEAEYGVLTDREPDVFAPE